MNCNGCGTDLDPTTEELNLAVDQILDTSLQDAIKSGGVCPLCGHSKEIPYSQRKAVQFGLLVATLMTALGIGAAIYFSHQTARAKVAAEVVVRLNQNTQITQLLGSPITLKEGILGDIKQDETGWNEAVLTLPVHAPKADAVVQVTGGKGTGQWVFTKLEVVILALHKKADLISGRVIEYDPSAYVELHTQAAAAPEYVMPNVAAATLPDSHPCVYAVASSGWALHIGQCKMPIPMMAASVVDRFEVDLRYGSFILRETDLFLKDAINIPLTRTYASGDWIHPNHMHAFGNNSSHPFDIAPLGSRNPYTWQVLVLEDGDFIFFDRISKGTGYADSLYLHSEIPSSFYKATQQWNGHGWTMRLADGSNIQFPESYSARNLAQGAALEMTDKQGNTLKMKRDVKRDLRWIEAPQGARMDFTYDDQSRIIKAVDNQGHWATYQYNPEGMLTDVVISSGMQRHYTYDGLKMTSISDQSGRVLVRNFYHNGWLIRQDTNSGIYFYDYESSPPYSYATQATITLPNGVKKSFSLADTVPSFLVHPPEAHN